MCSRNHVCVYVCTCVYTSDVNDADISDIDAEPRL